MKLVGRGDTTVVDAYLSPILSRYVRQVAGSWGITLPPAGPSPPTGGECRQSPTTSCQLPPDGEGQPRGSNRPA